MGYSYRNNGQIKDFWPDNSDTELYIPGNIGCSLQEILDRATEHFPGVALENLSISSEKIHTECLTYDLYDPSDYTDFIIIRKEN